MNEEEGRHVREREGGVRKREKRTKRSRNKSEEEERQRKGKRERDGMERRAWSERMEVCIARRKEGTGMREKE